MTVSLIDSKPEYYLSGSYRYASLTVDSTGENATGKWVKFTSTYSGSYWKTAYGALLTKRPAEITQTNYAPYDITIIKEGYIDYQIKETTPTANYILKVRLQEKHEITGYAFIWIIIILFSFYMQITSKTRIEKITWSILITALFFASYILGDTYFGMIGAFIGILLTGNELIKLASK